MDNPSEKYTYLELVDKNNQPITIISTQLQTPEAFESALSQYDDSNGKSIPSGFQVFPGGITNLRAGFEQYIHEPTQRYIPQITRQAAGNLATAAGTVSGVTPAMKLAEYLGIIPKDTMSNVVSTAANIGESAGNLLAGELSTPARTGATLATLPIAAMTPAVTTARGGISGLKLLSNMLTTGAGAATGYNIGKVLGGESADFGDTALEFTLAAGTSGLQGILSHYITKYIRPDMQEQVARGIVNTLTENRPVLRGRGQALDIGATSSQDLSRLTQQMVEGVRGSINETAGTLYADIMSEVGNTLPRNLSRSESAQLREATRKIVTLQNRMLENFSEPSVVGDYVDRIRIANTELKDLFTKFFPRSKNLTTITDSVGRVVQNSERDSQRYQEAAQVLYYLREAGAGGKLDLMRFAQLIRGNYQQSPGSALERVGQILGQGQPLTSLPTSGEAAPGQEVIRRGYNLAKELLPLGRYLPSIGYKGPSVPWQHPSQLPLSSVINPTVQIPAKATLRQGVDRAFGEEQSSNAINSYFGKR